MRLLRNSALSIFVHARDSTKIADLSHRNDFDRSDARELSALGKVKIVLAPLPHSYSFLRRQLRVVRAATYIFSITSPQISAKNRRSLSRTSINTTIHGIVPLYDHFSRDSALPISRSYAKIDENRGAVSPTTFPRTRRAKTATRLTRRAKFKTNKRYLLATSPSLARSCKWISRKVRVNNSRNLMYDLMYAFELQSPFVAKETFSGAFKK